MHFYPHCGQHFVPDAPTQLGSQRGARRGSAWSSSEVTMEKCAKRTMTPPSHKNADQPNYLGGLAAPLHPVRSNQHPKTCIPARTEPWRLGRDPHPTSMGRREPVGARGKWREGRRQGRAKGPAGSGGGKEKGGGAPRQQKGERENEKPDPEEKRQGHQQKARGGAQAHPTRAAPGRARENPTKPLRSARGKGKP